MRLWKLGKVGYESGGCVEMLLCYVLCRSGGLAVVWGRGKMGKIVKREMDHYSHYLIRSIVKFFNFASHFTNGQNTTITSLNSSMCHGFI